MRALLALWMVAGAATPAAAERVALASGERDAFLAAARERAERVARDLRGQNLPLHLDRAPDEAVDMLAAFLAQPDVVVDRPAGGLDPGREITLHSGRERAVFWIAPETPTFGPSQGYFIATDVGTGAVVRELSITAGGGARRPYLRRMTRMGGRSRSTAEQYEPLPGGRWLRGDHEEGKRSTYAVLGRRGRQTRISRKTALRLVNLPTEGLARSGVQLVVGQDGTVRFRRTAGFDPKRLVRETRHTFVPRRGKRAAHVRRLPRR